MLAAARLTWFWPEPHVEIAAALTGRGKSCCALAQGCTLGYSRVFPTGRRTPHDCATLCLQTPHDCATLCLRTPHDCATLCLYDPNAGDMGMPIYGKTAIRTATWPRIEHFEQRRAFVQLP